MASSFHRLEDSPDILLRDEPTTQSLINDKSDFTENGDYSQQNCEIINDDYNISQSNVFGKFACCGPKRNFCPGRKRKPVELENNKKLDTNKRELKDGDINQLMDSDCCTSIDSNISTAISNTVQLTKNWMKLKGSLDAGKPDPTDKTYLKDKVSMTRRDVGSSKSSEKLLERTCDSCNSPGFDPNWKSSLIGGMIYFLQTIITNFKTIWDDNSNTITKYTYQNLDLCIDYIIGFTTAIIFSLSSICWKGGVYICGTILNVFEEQILTSGISIPNEIICLQLRNASEILGISTSYLYRGCVQMTRYAGTISVTSLKIIFKAMLIVLLIISELVTRLMVIPLTNLLIVIFDVDCYMEDALITFTEIFIRDCKSFIVRTIGAINNFWLKACLIDLLCFRMRFFIIKVFCAILSIRRFILPIHRMVETVIDVIDTFKIYIGIMTDSIYLIYVLVGVIANGLFYFHYYIMLFINCLCAISAFAKSIHDFFKSYRQV